MSSKYQRAPSPGSNKVRPRRTESLAGIASAIARDKQERAAVPRPKVSLPKLKFLEREMPAWDEPLPSRRHRSKQ